MEADLTPWIFASILLVGVIYLLFSILFGGVADLDLGLDLDMGGGLDVDDTGSVDSSEARGVGCSVIAAFMTGFGSVALMGELSDWELVFSILAGIAFGLIFGRTMWGALRFIVRQHSNDLLTKHRLIGEFARITVDTPAGQVGEALVESDMVIKYAVRAEVPLSKGDYVEIVDVEDGRLYVKKKRNEANSNHAVHR